MVICLEQGADLHMAQLTPLPLTVSCFSKIQIDFTFWYWLTRVILDKGPINGCVCTVCGKVYVTVRCPSVPSVDRCTPLRRVCCCGPSRQEISIDGGGRRAPHQRGAQQQMRAVSRCQLMYEAENKKEKKVFPYSLPSIGPGADPGVQAVSPQVTSSESRHRPGSRLLLLSARPTVTSVAFTR